MSSTTAHHLVVLSAATVAVLNGVAGALGAWRWYRVEQSRSFWIWARAGQAGALAFALLAGLLWVGKRRAGQDLFYLYALLPLAINLIAEQLRVASAEAVLAARGLESAREVGELPEDEQRSIVTAILRRELGVIAAATIVVCFLAIRAAGTF